MNNRIEHQADDRSGGPNEELTILDDRYALEFPLAYAASGTAWLATDTFTAGAKRVVVKFLSRLDEADADELVLLRTRLTPAQLQAARALPRIDDLGGFEAEPYIVFSRIDGQPLDEYLSENAEASPVSSEDSAPVSSGRATVPLGALLQLAKAVQAMHVAGVMHLDIAPANLTYDESADAVRLLDWGHALARDSHAPPIPPASELAIYAGPGMFDDVDPQPRDDVYSVACVIYEVLSGAHPYVEHPANTAAELQLTPTPIASLNADQNAVLALALSTSRKQPPVDMAQLIAVFEHGVASVPQASVAPLAKAPDPVRVPVRPAAASAAKPSPAAAPNDQLAARTASIEAMIGRDQSSRAQPPSAPEPDLVEPSIAHEYISAEDTMPPRAMASLAEEPTRLRVPRADEATAAPISASSPRERAEPFISSPSQPPVSRGPTSQTPPSHGPLSQPPRSSGAMSQPPRSLGALSQPPRAQAPLSQPPLSHGAASQPQFSQPPRSQRPPSPQPLSQPPLSQPPLTARPATSQGTNTAAHRARPMDPEVDQLFRGTEFERTQPNQSRTRDWAVSVPLGLTITVASCVIGVVAGVWLASSGSGKRAAGSSDAPAVSAPAPVEATPAAAAPGSSGPAAESKPAAAGPADSAIAKPEPSPAPAVKPNAPEAVATPAPAIKPAAPPAATAPAPKPVAPAAAVPAPKPAAPPVAAAPPRPFVAPVAPVAPVANAPGAPQAGVDLLDATMATRALTERVARETEEELARMRAASKQPQ